MKCPRCQAENLASQKFFRECDIPLTQAPTTRSIHERAMFAPIWELAFLHGVGPRVEESGLGLLAGYGFSAPYEDVKLRAK